MKKISVSKRTWRQLCQLKSKRNLSSISKVVEYLINSQHVLKGENLQKTKDEKPIAENIKNLEVKMVLPDIRARVDQILQEKQSKAVPEEKKEQPLLFKIQCMECGHMLFSVDEVISESGIKCPRCEHVYSIAVNRDSDDQVLFRCMECDRSFSVNDIKTDRWAIHCPHCRHLHKIRVLLNEKKGGKNEFKKRLDSYQK